MEHLVPSMVQRSSKPLSRNDTNALIVVSDDEQAMPPQPTTPPEAVAAGMAMAEGQHGAVQEDVICYRGGGSAEPLTDRLRRNRLRRAALRCRQAKARHVAEWLCMRCGASNWEQHQECRSCRFHMPWCLALVPGADLAWFRWQPWAVVREQLRAHNSARGRKRSREDAAPPPNRGNRPRSPRMPPPALPREADEARPEQAPTTPLTPCAVQPAPTMQPWQESANAQAASSNSVPPHLRHVPVPPKPVSLGVAGTDAHVGVGHGSSQSQAMPVPPRPPSQHASVQTDEGSLDPPWWARPTHAPSKKPPAPPLPSRRSSTYHVHLHMNAARGAPPPAP